MDNHDLLKAIAERIARLEHRICELEGQNSSTGVHLPSYYDGESDFGQFLREFENFAKVKNWSQKKCTLAFPTFLKDAALEVYENLSDEAKTNWGILISEFPEELKRSEEFEKQINVITECVLHNLRMDGVLDQEEPEDEFYDAPGYDDCEADDDEEDQDEFGGPTCGPFGDSDYDDEDEYYPDDYEDGFRRSPNFWRPSTHSA